MTGFVHTCHGTCFRKQLSENKVKGVGMILAKPCKSAAHLFHTAENPRQHIPSEVEMPNYAVKSDPTKEWNII